MTVRTSISPNTQLWQDAAAELTPAKSLDRLNDNAKFLAGSLSIVGSIFTGIGILNIDRLRVDGAAYAVALVAGLLAVLAVLASVAMLVIRMKPLHIGNLREVEDWYRGQLARGGVLTIAGWALAASIALGTGASAFVLLHDQSAMPSMSLQLAGMGADEKLSAKVNVQGLAPGTKVQTSIIGLGGASQHVILASNSSVADATGKIDVSIEVIQVSAYKAFRLEVFPSNRKQPMTLELQATGRSNND